MILGKVQTVYLFINNIPKAQILGLGLKLF